MQPIRWQVGSFCVTNGENFENSGHLVIQEVSPLGRGILTNGAVSKWCGPKSGEASQSRPESARKMSPEIQQKHEDLKSLVDIPRLPHASGNRMLQNF